MRKIISSLIAIVFAVSLTACGTTHQSATNPVPSTSHSKVSKPRKVSKPKVQSEQTAQAEEPEPQRPATDYNALAARVIAGEFGDGNARRAALGSDYDQVQAIVNSLMSQPVQSAPVSQPTQSAPQAIQQSVEQHAPVEVTQPEPSEVAQPVEPADAPDDVVAEFSADPSQSWDDWRTEFGSDADVDVPLSQVPVCAALDGSTGTGYENVCQATSADGLHYVLVGGTAMEVWR